MRYARIDWHHTFSDEPKSILYEIADDNSVKRSVEIFSDDRIEYLSVESFSSEHWLGTIPNLIEGNFPDEKDFASMSGGETDYTAITVEDFNTAWRG